MSFVDAIGAVFFGLYVWALVASSAADSPARDGAW